jgi:roadblock/LC7 domain-containing protein
MNALIAILFSALAICLSFWVMIVGWGVEPQNWLVIVGGTIGVLLLIAIGFVVGANQ